MKNILNLRAFILLVFAFLLIFFLIIDLPEKNRSKKILKRDLISNVYAGSFSFPDNSFVPNLVDWEFDSGWLDMNSEGSCGVNCQCIDGRRISSYTNDCTSGGYHTNCQWIHDSAIAVVDYYLDSPFESSNDCLASVNAKYSEEIFGQENESFKLAINGSEAYFPDQEAGQHQVTSTERLTLNRGWNRVYFLATGWCDGDSDSVHFGWGGNGREAVRFRCNQDSSRVEMNVNFTTPVDFGETAIVDWSIEGAESCFTAKGDADWRSLNSDDLIGNGYYQSGQLAEDTDFSLTCQDDQGNLEKREFTVQVQDLQGLKISFYPEDYSIYDGDSVKITWNVQGAEGCYGWSYPVDLNWPSGPRNSYGGQVLSFPSENTEYYLRCASETTGTSLVRDFRVVVSDEPEIKNACGVQDKLASCEKPSSDLCANGGESEVVFNSNTGYWEWSCTDDNSGLIFNCQSKFYCKVDPMKWNEK